MDLGVVSFGRFLGTNPHWPGTNERPPTALEATIELLSPLSHGLPIGKLAQLDAIVAAGTHQQAHTGGDTGPDTRDPNFRHVFHKRQAAAQVITRARVRLQNSPTQFWYRGWPPHFNGLNARCWSVLLDAIYAAYVLAHATPQTHPDLFVVAQVGMLGGSAYLANELRQDDLTVPASSLRASIIGAAQAFHGRLG